MLTRTISATDVRVPAPNPGEAVIVSRFKEDRRKAVVVHPDDFDLFERMLEVFGEHQPYEFKLSDLAIEAHRLSEQGDDTDRPDLGSLKAALGD